MVASIAAFASAAFVATSLATGVSSGSGPDLPAWLPAATLPVVAVPNDAQLAISNLISSDDAAKYGITPASFLSARVLTQTDIGPLYVLPGATGICLAFSSTPTIACTDDLSQQGPRSAVVALLVPNSAGQLVGGGLEATKGARVSLNAPSVTRVSTHATPGGFVVTASDNVTAKPHDTIDLLAG
jgi:hypothetical protein